MNGVLKLIDIKPITEPNKIPLIPLLLFIGLIILRFPFVFGVEFNLLSISKDQLVSIYFEGTYLLTAILIWCERERLAKFNLGLGSLIIFLGTPLAKPIIYKILNPYVPFHWAFSWPEIVISLSLIIALFVSRLQLRTTKVNKMMIWTATGILVGIVVGTVLGYIYSFSSISQRDPLQPTLPLLGYLFITQVSYAAIAEEPLFRGFLWGYLRLLNWKEQWIWLFQAGLFMLAHLYYINQLPLSFWVIVPLSGLILGLLVWKSKSIATSMIAHGLFNSIADLVSHYTW